MRFRRKSVSPILFTINVWNLVGNALITTTSRGYAILKERPPLPFAEEIDRRLSLKGHRYRSYDNYQHDHDHGRYPYDPHYQLYDDDPTPFTSRQNRFNYRHRYRYHGRNKFYQHYKKYYEGYKLKRRQSAESSIMTGPRTVLGRIITGIRRIISGARKIRRRSVQTDRQDADQNLIMPYFGSGVVLGGPFREEMSNFFSSTTAATTATPATPYNTCTGIRCSGNSDTCSVATGTCLCGTAGACGGTDTTSNRCSGSACVCGSTGGKCTTSTIPVCLELSGRIQSTPSSTSTTATCQCNSDSQCGTTCCLASTPRVDLLKIGTCKTNPTACQ